MCHGSHGSNGDFALLSLPTTQVQYKYKHLYTLSRMLSTIMTKKDICCCIKRLLLQVCVVILYQCKFSDAFVHEKFNTQSRTSFANVRPALSNSALLAVESQLAQLASITTLSIDSGDLEVIEEYANTGYITDATTNPLFVSQAGLNSDSNPVYGQMVSDAIQYAIDNTSEPSKNLASTVGLAIDRLAVNLGKSISQLVTGYVSTEVDPRLSFDTDASVERALRIIDMYEKMGVPKSRILIKLAATWEGIKAAEILERDYGIQCNLTLIFSIVQAVACAQYGAHLISPFPGRILDWHKIKNGRTGGVDTPDLDEGVIACRDMYNYFKIHGHNTICMPASWRPSRGPGYELDEIIALAGTDRMTIPAPLLQKLASSTEPISRKLTVENALEQVNSYPVMDDGKMTEQQFRYRMNLDGCGTEKLAEGIRAFIGETDKLENVITAKIFESLKVST
jgi:transaldolase